MNYKIKLGNEYITERVALPFNVQTTLDESLDQAQIRLQVIDIVEPIKPLSELSIEIWNKENTYIEKTYYFFVSNDQVVDNLQSNTYTHNIQLIEQTKWLERFTNIIKTNTNPLIHDYTENQSNVYIKQTIDGVSTEYEFYSNVYKTPEKEGQLTILGYSNFADAIETGWDYNYGSVVVKENGKVILDTAENEDKIINTKAGQIYDIEYAGMQGISGTINRFYISVCVVAEKTSRTDITITQAVEDLLQTFETLTRNQTPRFTFNSEQAIEYSEIIAPEFSLNGTLFECLQQIGNYIHGIPRLQNGVISFDKLGGNEKTTKDLTEFVGQTKSFTIEQYATSLDSYVDNLVNTDAVDEGSLTEPTFNGWKTVRTDLGVVQLTSDNIFIETSEAIEQIIKVECGFVSGRTSIVGDITSFVYSKTEYDGQLSSISDTYPLSKGYAIYYNQGSKNIYGLNFKIPNAISPVFSNFAIINIINKVTGGDYDLQDIMNLQFRVTYIPNVNGRVKQTKTELSELEKSSAITYNQNAPKISSKHYGEAIKGALAKLGNPEIVKSYVFSDINSLPQVGELFDNDHYISLIRTEFYNDFYKCDIALSKNYNRKDQYTALNSHIRFYEISEQMAQDRQIYYEDACIIGQDVEYELKRVYFEPSHIVDYGTMKELVVGENEYPMPTQTRGNYKFILQYGNTRTKIDVAELPFTTTVGGSYELTLNGISEGILQITVESAPDKLYIDLEEVNANITKPLITEEGLALFAENLRITSEDELLTKVIQNANTKTFDKKDNILHEFDLPTTAISMGNAILMHYEFIDNFTAGTKRTTEAGSKLQYQQSYTDIYGEIEYIEFGLGEIDFTNPINTYDEAVEYGNSLPGVEYEGKKYINYFEAKDDTALIIKKDNREVIGINYQVNFISNDNLIIGDELPKSSWFIKGGKPQYKLYLLKDLIPKFAKEIDLTNAVDLGGLTIIESPNGTEKMQIKIANKSPEEIANNTGIAWAICNNNKLVFGKNQRVEPNKELVLPFITFKHIIY